MSAATLSAGLRRSAWLRGLRRAGWPVALGLAASVAGLLMIAASLVLVSPAGSPAADPGGRTPKLRGASPATTRAAPADDFNAPGAETHLDDLAAIFATATEHGITLGAVDYRTEAQMSLPVLVRTLDIRLAEDYPKFKPFVADLLARIPHLYLREIRIDRGSVEASRAQITLKLSLVYRTGDRGVPSGSRAAAAMSSTGSAQP